MKICKADLGLKNFAMTEKGEVFIRLNRESVWMKIEEIYLKKGLFNAINLETGFPAYVPNSEKIRILNADLIIN